MPRARHLIGDAENIYDLNRLDDQLLLGIKGTLSVIELGTLKLRMQQGREAKARRGELRRAPAPGYVMSVDRRIVKDPNLRVQEAMAKVFSRFGVLGSIRQTHRWVPRRARRAAGEQGGPWTLRAALAAADCQLHQLLFANAGLFPLEEFAVSQGDKWLYGVQIGTDVALGARTQLRLGLGHYDFHNVEGERESAPPPTGSLAGNVAYQTSQYPAGVRLRGNTQINLNDPTSTAAPVWGLASKFRPINLTAALTFIQFHPVHVGLTLDYVKNSGFDRADIGRRAGMPAVGDLAEKTRSLQLLGSPRLADRGDWNALVAMRQFERDAWVDAFTDTTWHLGGTNYKGYSLGGAYTLVRRAGTLALFVLAASAVPGSVVLRRAERPTAPRRPSAPSRGPVPRLSPV